MNQAAPPDKWSALITANSNQQLYSQYLDNFTVQFGDNVDHCILILCSEHWGWDRLPSAVQWECRGSDSGGILEPFIVVRFCPVCAVITCHSRKPWSCWRSGEARMLLSTSNTWFLHLSRVSSENCNLCAQDIKTSHLEMFRVAVG